MIPGHPFRKVREKDGHAGRHRCFGMKNPRWLGTGSSKIPNLARSWKSQASKTGETSGIRRALFGVDRLWWLGEVAVGSLAGFFIWLALPGFEQRFDLVHQIWEAPGILFFGGLF